MNPNFSRTQVVKPYLLILGALTIEAISFFCPSTPLRMTKKDKAESVLKRPNHYRTHQ